MLKYVHLASERNDCKIMERYTEVNARTVDRWVDGGWVWGTPITAGDCKSVRRGDWDVLLTPRTPVPKEWFPAFPGTRILGLASGGGQQMPVFAMLGAQCTVMDYSDRQLENERMVAKREGFDIDIVKGDMTLDFPFEDGAFDLIFHPVSNIYVEDVHHVWRECFRVLRRGGVLLSGLDNGLAYLFDVDKVGEPLVVNNTLPFNPLKNPEQMEKSLKDDGGIQFSHTFDDQIGGQLKAGFIIVDAYEDYDHYPDDNLATVAAGIPKYWVTKALKM